MTMDCEACNSLLLDYLYEDVDEVRAAAVRRHLEGCSSCQEYFDRLRRGREAARALPLEEPPEASAALAAAIRDAAARPSARPAEERPVPSIAPDPVRRSVLKWLQRAGEVAMRRQVAMAAVFLLMIGFGLSYLQVRSPTRPLPSSDEPGGRVVPATEVVREDERRPAAQVAARPVGRAGPSERGVAQRSGSVAHGNLAANTAAAPSGSTDSVDDTPPSVQAAQPSSRDGRPTPFGEGALARGGGSPAAYRSLPAAQSEEAQEPPLRGVGLEPGLAQGLPAAPVPSPNLEAQRVAEAENDRARSDSGAGWRAYRDTAESLRARGQADLATTAYRNALALDPPETDRVAIARRLYDVLLASGRVREATNVQAQYLLRINSPGAVVAQESPGSRGTVTSTRPSAPRPSVAAPRRVRAAPVSQDSYSNMAY